MIDIDPDIEKQISLIQEEKLNSKLKEDIKKVVKVAEQPTEKLVDFFSVIADEKKQTKERVAKSEKKIANIILCKYFISKDLFVFIINIDINKVKQRCQHQVVIVTI